MFKNLHPRKTKNLIGHEEQIKTFVINGFFTKIYGLRRNYSQ